MSSDLASWDVGAALRRWARWFRPGLGVLLALLLLYPLWGTGYGVRVLLQLFMWIALAQSWNLISGLTGYVSFGHVAFFGMGAYTASILVTKGVPWPIAARPPHPKRSARSQTCQMAMSWVV